MNPQEFIVQAGALVTRGQAGARTAISRAYYGVFHIARELLSEFSPFVPRNSQGHTLIPEYLRLTSNSQAAQVASMLTALRADRLKADYELLDTEVETSQFAMPQVELAYAAVKLLGDYQAVCRADAVTKQQLVTAIEKVNAVRKVTIR